jgi:hypothetical protein
MTWDGRYHRYRSPASHRRRWGLLNKARSPFILKIPWSSETDRTQRSTGAFAIPHGELAFAPGSSGWPLDHHDELR